MARVQTGGYTAAMNTLRPLIGSLLSSALALAVTPALAQWQWVDKDGRKVFSDRAPPPEILDKNILQRPATRNKATAPDSADSKEPASLSDTSKAAVSSGNAPALPAADKELEAKKKQAADAEAAKRKADEERIAKQRIENCARAKQAKATLDTGARIAQTNAKGEREIMDDAARAVESKRIQGIIESECR